jgi:2-polyprenyl-3-methyl-5-hydroxy-6-metoxy-1,4-benzoquinol methylase
MVSYYEARRVRADHDGSESPLGAHWGLVLPHDKAARILDLGCGRGGILRSLRKMGYENLSGIDGDAAAVDYCRTSGLAVDLGDIVSWCSTTSERFDLVILNHVLEHLDKPSVIPFLKTLAEILSQGGTLYVAVPNAQSNTGSYWAFEDFTHSTIFTSGSIHYVAIMAGFRSVEYLDMDCTAGSKFHISIFRKSLLFLYKANKKFWNKVTRSAYHSDSPDIYSYEIKAALRR